MKELIALISSEGKTPEQVHKELLENWKKFLEVEQKVKSEQENDLNEQSPTKKT
ncbi:hypothetical protein GX865_01860 [Candidatus Saccharibacteria bacterium]|jgi:hypothetical protein|nr:hypothetical protein [Candidatus Saccharibacteria bacterium]